jgi:hypothetical protein
MATEAGEQPVWVAPFVHEVRELIGVGTMSIVDEDCPTSTRMACGGMVSAAGWVHGQLFGPITERHDLPVTAQAAEAELAVAGVVVFDHDPDSVRRYCASFGEPYLPPVSFGQGRDYAMGAVLTLRWLLGRDHQSPLPVPLRHPGGRLVTAAEVFRVMLADEPDATEQRRTELHRRAAEMVAESVSIARSLHDFNVRSQQQS